MHNLSLLVRERIMFYNFATSHQQSTYVDDDDSNMEFERDIMMQDCFSTGDGGFKFGFVTNVTLIEEACTLNVTCRENGDRIQTTRSGPSSREGK